MREREVEKIGEERQRRPGALNTPAGAEEVGASTPISVLWATLARSRPTIHGPQRGKKNRPAFVHQAMVGRPR